MRQQLRTSACALAIAAALGVSIMDVLAQPSLPPGVTPGMIKKKKESNPPPKPTRPPGEEVMVPEDKAPWKDKVLLKGRELHWLVTAEVSLRPINTTGDKGQPTTQPIAFSTAAVVFPILENTAAHREVTANRKGDLKFDGKSFDAQPTLLKGYHSGVRLGKWEARDVLALDMRFTVDIGMACASTTLDEPLAAKIPWPKVFPAVAMSTFKPQLYVDYINSEHEKAANDAEVQKLIATWLGGKDPKTIAPVVLAKQLMGKVVEAVQISGNGLDFNREGLFRGFNLKGATATLRDGIGSEHDIACALAYVYRLAGLPARTVIGMDNSDDNKIDKVKTGSYNKKLHSWVEFCLVDPGTGKEIWIPADPQRQRASGSRVPNINQAWKFFGNHKELGNMMPLAFQYHPPTTVVAHGAPCMWGWLTTPTIPYVDQSVRFKVNSRPRRTNDDPGPDAPESPGN